MRIRACCIAIDIKGSEEIENKNLLIKKLKIRIQDLNIKYKNTLIVPFDIIRGDEIIGVLASFKDGYSAYRDFEFLCEELKIEAYCGMGLGIVDTNLDIKLNFLNTKGVLLNSFEKFDSNYDLEQINGSAIISAFRARDLFLKGMGKKSNSQEIYLFENTNNVSIFVYNNESEIPYQIINYLIYEVNKHWHECSDLQKHALKIYEESNYQLAYKEIGIKLNYSKNAAQNARSILQNARTELFKNKIETVNEMLDYVERNYRY